MAVAPKLFKFDNANECLLNIEQILMGKNAMGMKTLDPSDKNYNGDYINSDATNGFNYH
jgi:glycogen debranching enzyme